MVTYFSNLPCALFTLDLLIWCAIFSVNTYKKNSFFLKKSLKESIMFYLRVTNYFSSSTPHNQRVLFFIKITVFCRLSFENMRFCFGSKSCLSGSQFLVHLGFLDSISDLLDSILGLRGVNFRPLRFYLINWPFFSKAQKLKYGYFHYFRSS